MKQYPFGMLLMLAFLTHAGGCADFNEAMFECMEWTVEYSGYDNDTGNYVPGLYSYQPGDEQRELDWIYDAMDSYLEYPSRGIYLKTSPISDTSYRFDVHCSSYL